MRKILGITYNCNNLEEQETVRKCLQILSPKFKIINIPQHKVVDHITQDMLAIAFGKPAGAIAQDSTSRISNVYQVTLPPPSSLTDKLSNRIDREEAYKILLQAKEILDQETSITDNLTLSPDDLPDWKTDQVLLLSKRMEESGENSVFVANMNGQILEISNKINPNSKADINLTISELYSLKCIIDIFGNNEIEIQRK